MQASVRGKVPLVQSMAPKGSRGLATHTTGVGRGPINLGAYRNFFTRVIRHTVPRLTQLLGPVPSSTGPIGSRLHHKLPETIHSRLSLSSRMALSRPLKAGGMPRPPMLPRPMHEVGLGTARKFSSQSAFQHIVQNNTSITARAFWEADWDLKAAEERRVVAKARPRRTKASKSKSKSLTSTRFSDDMSVYFPEPLAAAVTTFLQIALAPTPSNAMPLISADEALHLLPLRAILDSHTAFQARAQDVAAIFAVLDSNEVWNDGVDVESWGDTRGLCVELRVKFEGWTETRVRSLLSNLVDIPGCSLQEISLIPVPSIIGEVEDSLEYSAPLEFVMPASIAMSDSLEHFDASVQSTRPNSPSAFSFASDSDNLILSDLDVDMSDGLSDHSHEPASSIPNNLVLSLSSAFLSRIEDSNSIWSAE